jgi:hypothetical protein
MDLYDLAEQLSDLLDGTRSAFLKTEPEVPDHTDPSPFTLVLFAGAGRLTIPDVTRDDIVGLAGLLDATAFDKDRVDRLYVWNFKSLCTYFHAATGKFLAPTTSLIDLKVVENFLGIRKPPPENMAACVDRVKAAVHYKGWQPVYKSVHLPLILKVLPAIEATPLLNEATKRSEYPYYEIEGQTNGRMNCLKKFAKSYLPHNMGPDVRAVLKPKGYGYRFLYADFHYNEVAVLQWLSKDRVLGAMLAADRDLYTQIYELVTKDACDTDKKRKMAKLMILAVMYGSGKRGLAESLSLPEPVAGELIHRLGAEIPEAMQWMEDRAEAAKAGQVLDYFSRPRTFPEGQHYLARSAAIQGVAATVCQEKLIDLSGRLDSSRAYIAFSVHDGFGAVTRVDAAHDTYKVVKATLESESKLCPGLTMKVDIKFGAKLNAMKVLWRD